MNLSYIHRAKPLAVAAAAAIAGFFLKLHRAEPVKQLNQGQHRTDQAKKAIFEKAAGNHDPGEGQVDKSKEQRHPVGIIKRQSAKISCK